MLGHEKALGSRPLFSPYANGFATGQAGSAGCQTGGDPHSVSCVECVVCVKGPRGSTDTGLADEVSLTRFELWHPALQCGGEKVEKGAVWLGAIKTTPWKAIKTAAWPSL